MKRINVGVVIALLSLSGALPAADIAPNIVYIISDDQTWSDFGFMGNDRVHTPNLDKLASQSAAFPNGYLTTSVCRPSLVTLMTGLYCHQHQIHFNHGPPGNSAYNRMDDPDLYVATREKEFELIGKVDTLPRLLVEEAGYRVLQTGKFWEGHWRNAGFTEGMTTFTAPPATQTYGGIRTLASGDSVAHGNGDAGLQIGRETMKPIEDFILDCERKAAPWMVWYAPYLPHQPHDSPKKFYDMAESMPGVKPHEIPYFASIAQFDETVGDLIDFVEGNANAENTIFVFVSDNGWAPGEKRERSRPEEFAHTKTSKRAPFDEGVRSPILFRWDGVIPPGRHDELVSSIDIVPTLLKLAGVEADAFETMPGIDLTGDLDRERAVFGAIFPGDAESIGHPEREVAYRWVRQGDYKLIVPVGSNAWGGYLKKPALFNVAIDPREKEDLIESGEMEEVRSSLEVRLDQWWRP
ncbi:MAG: sulfatase-like hydrolase/transferase [Verrucomicrobiales bacterium]|nr:sulfatase-like hydrolase/transferase [Verrucomicrobiales bacterium]